MEQQFDLRLSRVIDLGHLCFQLDSAHWNARRQMTELVIKGSTGGPWIQDEFVRQVTSDGMRERWENTVLQSAASVPDIPVHQTVSLQSLAARTLGWYVNKEVRDGSRKSAENDCWEAAHIDDSIRDCTRLVMPGEIVTESDIPIDAANDVGAIYDCLAVLALLQTEGKKYLTEEELRYAEVLVHCSVSRIRPSVKPLP